MDAIKTWAFGICCAALAGGLTELVLPKSGVQRVIKVVVSVFFLSCIFAPVDIGTPIITDLLRQTPAELENLQWETKRLSESWQTTQSAYIEDNLKRQAHAFLEENGVSAEKIRLINHETEDGRIIISECEIQLMGESAADLTALREELEKTLGVPVRFKKRE